MKKLIFLQIFSFSVTQLAFSFGHWSIPEEYLDISSKVIQDKYFNQTEANLITDEIIGFHIDHLLNRGDNDAKWDSELARHIYESESLLASVAFLLNLSVEFPEKFKQGFQNLSPQDQKKFLSDQNSARGSTRLEVYDLLSSLAGQNYLSIPSLEILIQLPFNEKLSDFNPYYDRNHNLSIQTTKSLYRAYLNGLLGHQATDDSPIHFVYEKKTGVLGTLICAGELNIEMRARGIQKQGMLQTISINNPYDFEPHEKTSHEFTCAGKKYEISVNSMENISSTCTQNLCPKIDVNQMNDPKSDGIDVLMPFSLIDSLGLIEFHALINLLRLKGYSVERQEDTQSPRQRFKELFNNADLLVPIGHSIEGSFIAGYNNGRFVNATKEINGKKFNINLFLPGEKKGDKVIFTQHEMAELLRTRSEIKTHGLVWVPISCYSDSSLKYWEDLYKFSIYQTACSVPQGQNQFDFNVQPPALFGARKGFNSNPSGYIENLLYPETLFESVAQGSSIEEIFAKLEEIDYRPTSNKNSAYDVNEIVKNFHPIIIKGDDGFELVY